MDVDIGHAVWRKSTRSGGAHDCVEVANNLPSVVAVRDSKDRNGSVLTFTDAEWTTFVGKVKSGELDRH